MEWANGKVKQVAQEPLPCLTDVFMCVCFFSFVKQVIQFESHQFSETEFLAVLDHAGWMMMIKYRGGL